MKRKLLYFLLLLLPLVAKSQTWEWEHKIIGWGPYNPASNIIVDKSGNSYFLVEDSSSFAESSNNIIKIGDPSLVKISPEGILIWKATIHSSDSSWIIAAYPYEGAINITPDGNIIVCAALPGALSFGNITLPADSKHPIPNNINNKVWTQIFLAECDTSGLWQQASILGAITTADEIDGIAMNKNASVNVAISYRDSLTIGSTSYRANPYDTIKPYSQYDLWYSTYVGNFKMDGQLSWGKNYPGLQIPLSQNNLNHIILDQNNQLYFILEDTFSEYIYKLRPDGSLIYSKNIPAPIQDFRLDNADNITICGMLFDTVNFGNNIILKGTTKGNGFVVKLDSAFTAQTGFILEGVSGNVIFQICPEKSGSLFILGRFDGNLKFGDSVYSNLNYLRSFFIAEYSATGSTSMKSIMPHSNTMPADFILDSSGKLIIDWFLDDFIGYGNIVLGCDTIYDYSEINVLTKLDPRLLSINKIPFCTGDSLICTDTSLYSNLTWKFRDGTTQTGNKIVYPSKTKGYYHFTLYATNSVGCQVFISDSFKHPAPPVAAFSMKDSVACEYTKVILNDISKTDTIAPGNWPQDTWDFGDGTSSQTNKTATKIYQDTGSFKIKLSYNNGFCTTDTALKINVIPAPKPGFNVSDSVGCPPLAVQISNASTKLVSSYYYDFGNGMHDTVQSPIISYTKSGNYKILQKLKGPSGCVTEDSAIIHVRRAFSSKDTSDIENVSVGGSHYIGIQWAGMPGCSVYDLYRYSDHDSASNKLILQTKYAIYTDSININSDAHSYTYSFQAEDSCGNVTSRGRVGRTMLLTGSLDQNLNPVLKWNPYFGWPNGVGDHSIYREKADSSFVMVGYSHDTIFTDFSFEKNPVYEECYRVDAYANNYPFVSRSNYFCFGTSPEIFVPDIFTPNGDTLNDIFTPVFSGIASWSMEIYNRWGGKIYSFSSPSERPGEAGWDGTFKGQPAPYGVYAYYINAKDYNGNAIIKKGTVILER